MQDALIRKLESFEELTEANREVLRAPNRTARLGRLGVGVVWLARFSLTISGLQSPRFCRPTRLARRAGAPGWTIGLP